MFRSRKLSGTNLKTSDSAISERNSSTTSSARSSSVKSRRTRSRRRAFLQALLGAAFTAFGLVGGGNLHGQTNYYWNGGTGTWNTSSNLWRTPAVGSALGPWVNGTSNVANIGDLGASGTITTGSAITLNRINFNATGYTVTGTASNLITLGGSTPTISVGSGVVATLGTTSLTPTNIIGFTGGLVVSGGGDLRLAGSVANTSTGGITVNSSTLTVGDPTVSTGAQNAPRQNLGGQALTLNNSNLVVATQNSLFTSTFQVASLTSTGSSTINIFRTGSANSTGLSFTTDGGANSTLYSSLNVQGALTITGGGNNNSTAAVAAVGATTLTGATTFSTVAGLPTSGINTVTTVLSLGGNSGSSSGALVGAVTDGGNSMKFLGGGTSTTQGGQLRIGGVGNTLSGTLTIGNSDGTGAGSVFIGGGSSSLTSGNVTVNAYSQLLINNTLAGGSTTYGTAGQTITLSGIGNQTLAGAGSSGALRFDVFSGTQTAAYSNTVQSSIALAADSVISVAGSSAQGLANTATLSGGVSGSGGLQKQGSGTLVLSAASTYGGATSIGNGALTVAATGSLGTGSLSLAQTSTNNTALNLNNASQTVGSLSSSFAATSGTQTQVITLNGTALNVNQTTDGTYGTGDVSTLTSTIAGTGSLTKSGNATLTLTGANTYSGGTTVSAGTLAVGASSIGTTTITSGAVGTGTLTLNGGTIRSNAATTSGNRTIMNNLSLSGNITMGDSSNNGILTFNNTGLTTRSTVLTANTALTTNSDVVINNAISGSGISLSKAGSGRLALGGINTFSGTFSATGGIASLDVNNSLGSVTAVTVGAGTTVQSGFTGLTNVINDSAAVTLNGSGRLDLSGGTETIASIASSSATSSLVIGRFNNASGGFTVGDNNSTLFAGVIQNGTISGTGTTTFNKQGTGVMTLSNTNTYTGATNITAGGITLTNSAGLGASGASNGTVVSSGAVLALDGSAGNLSVGAELLTLNGAGLTSAPAGALRNIAGTNSYAGLVTLGSSSQISSDAGTLSLTNTGTITGSGANLTVGGAGNTSIASIIGTGAGGLTKVDAGTLTLSGVNTYTGGTNINGGTLVIANASALGSSGTISFGGGRLQYSGVTTDLSSRFSNAANQAYSIDTNGNNLTLGSSLSSAGGSLSKSGAGTLTLTGTNSYTGATSVTGGTLSVGSTGSIAGSGVSVGSGGTLNANGLVNTTVNVAAGGTLSGRGTIGGATIIDGVHSPGNSPGLQTFAAGLTYNTGSSLTWELIEDTLGVRGTHFDGIDVTGGTLTINSGVTSNLVFNGAGSLVNWGDDFWNVDRQWLVFDNANAPSLSLSPIFGTINVSNDGLGGSFSSIRSGASFSWSQTGNDVFLNYHSVITAVPEPSSLALFGVVVVSAAFVRRRKSTVESMS